MMFGYVMIHKDELKIKDYHTYHACYCGLCRSLKKRHGIAAPVTLSYDMTFLVLLLTGLYEEPFKSGTHHCILHGGKKQALLQNKWTDYAADMTILLAYHNLMDDWEDEKKFPQYTTARLLHPSYKKVAQNYPRQAAAVIRYMEHLHHAEVSDCRDLDQVAGFTGELLGQIFCPVEDVWKDYLYRCGFYLGKFIYLMDAYEDLEQDAKLKNYNPLSHLASRTDFDAIVENTLVMMMAECSKSFEKLPILQYADILRNILYSGVWFKYEIIKRKGND